MREPRLWDGKEGQVCKRGAAEMKDSVRKVEPAKANKAPMPDLGS